MQESICRDTRIELAKSQEFIQSIRAQRSNTNAAHVFGFLGDFGIGNTMEGNAAEASGEIRARELQNLAVQENCQSLSASGPSRIGADTE